MEYNYRDASYFERSYGRKRVRRVEASLGQLRAYGVNKSAAKAELEIVIRKQCENAYDRRYLMGTAHDGRPVVFAFYFNAGAWGYDIIRPHDGVFAQPSSTSYNEDTGFLEAWGRMLAHFEQYTEAAA